MNYVIRENEIIILNTADFNVKQILECGQIFRFEINNNHAVVYSNKYKAELETQNNQIIIKTNNVAYFENFFDLKTDYSKIKNKLFKDPFLAKAVEYGYGIRILNNDVYEMIISFIISANNNISRIKKSIEYLCCKFGEKQENFYAFPTLDQLKQATVENFKQAGLGYRAEQMFNTVQNLTNKKIDDLKNMQYEDQFKFLISLKGVGEKVANCILLFGLGVRNAFPVDTWINKVYNQINNTKETNRSKITKELTSKYGALSGYAQQYLFYYFRENKL